jgi:hypothetical protein
MALPVTCIHLVGNGLLYGHATPEGYAQRGKIKSRKPRVIAAMR